MDGNALVYIWRIMRSLECSHSSGDGLLSHVTQFCIWNRFRGDQCCYDSSLLIRLYWIDTVCHTFDLTISNFNAKFNDLLEFLPSSLSIYYMIILRLCHIPLLCSRLIQPVVLRFLGPASMWKDMLFIM